MKPAEGTTTNG